MFWVAHYGVMKGGLGGTLPIDKLKKNNMKKTFKLVFILFFSIQLFAQNPGN